MKTCILHLNGMHCKACELLTETELQDHPWVKSAKSDLKTQTVTLTGDFGDKTPEELAKELSSVLSQHSLSPLPATEKSSVDWNEFYIALPLALAILLGFIALQKSGLLNSFQADTVNYPAALLIGLIASISSCMAVVGGLILSLSANLTDDKKATQVGIIFHATRLVTFFVLGGAIGALGTAFQLGRTGSFVITVLTAGLMFLLGLHLLKVFSWTKHLLPGMPKHVSQKALAWTRLEHRFVPAFAGFATFFLPCGFTQSMQLYTLSTGGFWPGAWTLFFFALGTFPVLALMSFGSFRLGAHAKSGIFFKTTGLIVMAFALFNLLNGLASMGWITPLF